MELAAVNMPTFSVRLRPNVIAVAHISTESTPENVLRFIRGYIFIIPLNYTGMRRFSMRDTGK